MLTVPVISQSMTTRLRSSFLLTQNNDITFYGFHIAMPDSMPADLIDGSIYSLFYCTKRVVVLWIVLTADETLGSLLNDIDKYCDQHHLLSELQKSERTRVLI